jgi:predicted Zn-dependent protease
MRFYLAKNLRNFDQQYARAIEVADPLAARYPNNPVFQLLLGNLNSELNRTEEASEHFRAALRAAPAQGDCPRVRDLHDAGARDRQLVSREAELKIAE